MLSLDTLKITEINIPEMDTVIPPWSLLFREKKKKSVQEMCALTEQFKKLPVNQVSKDFLLLPSRMKNGVSRD